MPAPQVGTDFLASSHFQIAQDPWATHPAMKTTFNKDYTPHNITGRPAAAKPPAPAWLMHKDDRHFNTKRSETVKAYEYTPMAKPKLENAQETLQKTNFKMDCDLKKFDTFHTTHNTYYPVHNSESYILDKPKQEPMKSYVPQGDREKAPQPMSDYRDRYRGHDTSKVIVSKAESQHTGGPPTITGDGRLHQYAPTMSEAFQGRWLPKIAQLPAPRGTNIPQGDREKEVTAKTTQQDSYPERDMTGFKPYSKDAVTGKLQLTNFRLDDGQKTWDTYQSTAADSYTVKNDFVRRSNPDKHRNQSDFPEGDLDPGRVADRVNMTTSRYYHGEFPSWFRNKIESGADKRTKSNVWFGEPQLAQDFYDTTMEEEFNPKTVPYSYKRGDGQKSIIPLDYYGNELTQPTTWSDFQNPKQGKLIPNPEAIDNLRKTHIKPPLKGERDFATTHNLQFTPKAYSRHTISEPGKLQRSSVPLGTLQI